MSAAEDLTVDVHPFQRAGLGKAPFRVVGVAERVHVIPGVLSKAGGSCHYCATGIRYAVIVRSADGHVFDVGLDCARKVDGEMYREARRAFREERGREAREAEARSRAEEKIRREQAEDERERAYRERYPEVMTIIDMLRGADGFAGDFAARCLQNVRGNGCLAMPYRETFEEAQADARAKLRELRAEFRATGHVGTVGKRSTFVAEYVGHVVYDSFYGWQSVYKFEVDRGDGTYALLTWKTPAVLWVGEEMGVPYGTQLELTATVKEHTVYRGVPQTVLSRVKAVRGGRS